MANCIYSVGDTWHLTTYREALEYKKKNVIWKVRMYPNEIHSKIDSAVIKALFDGKQLVEGDYNVKGWFAKHHGKRFWCTAVLQLSEEKMALVKDERIIQYKRYQIKAGLPQQEPKEDLDDLVICTKTDYVDIGGDLWRDDVHDCAKKTEVGRAWSAWLDENSMKQRKQSKTKQIDEEQSKTKQIEEEQSNEKLNGILLILQQMNVKHSRDMSDIKGRLDKLEVKQEVVA
jgi:hypothetical protein